MPAFDILILGAGIVGCACAREAALAGLRVAIVEPGPIAGATTAAGMGHIVVMDDSPAQLALTRYGRALWQADAPQFPPEIPYDAPGTIWVAANSTELAEVHTKHAAYAAANVPTQIVTPEELRTLEPNLLLNLAGGLLVPGDAVTSPPAAAAFYLAEAQRHGATLIHGRATSAANGIVQIADGARLTAKHIVLATGIDCDLLPTLPIKPRKGHLVLTEPAPSFLNHQLVELGYLASAHASTGDSVAFNIQPRRTGQLCIGSSRQYNTSNPEPEPAIVHQMLARAHAYMPALAAIPTARTWTGFRAATPDKLPLIGPAFGLSDDPTLYLAAGFEGLGGTTAPAAARLLLDHILNRPSAIDPTPYLPSRLTHKEKP
jgi:glycine/D-amino acid oxidase-like deaminating enzyme